jgi:hypothetical protein
MSIGTPPASLIAGGSSIGGNDMKRLIAFLSTATICAVVSETPAAAQVAGKIGDLHTQTLYMREHDSNLGQGYANWPGYAGPLGLVGVPLALVGGPSAGVGAGPTTSAQPQARCGVIHDFNMSQSHYRYTAVCPLFP